MDSHRCTSLLLLLMLMMICSSSNAQQEASPATGQVDQDQGDEFLLRRPLNNIQIQLLGAYDPLKRDEFLEALKEIVEDTMYNSLVGYFVPTDEYIYDEHDDHRLYFNDTNTTNTITTTNATTRTDDTDNMDSWVIGFNKTNNTTEPSLPNTTQDPFQNATFIPKPQAQEEATKRSILSKVFIDWTSTNFEVDNDPFLHVFQARGSLGFNQYDYVLLHPQTILPLQETVMTGNSDVTNSTPISLGKMELMLRQQLFFFQVLQFIMVETDHEDNHPTPAPIEWGVVPNDDDVNDDAVADGSKNSTNITATTTEEAEEHDDDDDDEYVHPQPADAKIIRTALIVACALSTLALLLFARFVCVKTKQIKKDRLARKSLVKKKKKDGIIDSGSESDGRTKKTNVEDMSVTPSASSGTISSSNSSPKNLDIEALASNSTETNSGKNDTNSVATNGNDEQQKSPRQTESTLDSWTSLMIGRVCDVENDGAGEPLSCLQLPSCQPNSNSTMSPEKEKIDNFSYDVVEEEDLHDL